MKKKGIIIVAIIAMVFGNVNSFAQIAYFKNKKTDMGREIVLQQHYGTRGDNGYRPVSGYFSLVLAPGMSLDVDLSFTYDESYRVVERLETMDMYGLILRCSWEYDDNGNQIEMLQDVSMDLGATWINEILYTCTYENNQLSEGLWQQWSEDENEWENCELDIYTFSEDVSTVLYKLWVEGQWVDDQLDTYTFGDDSYEVLKQLPMNGNWINYGKETHLLNAMGTPTEILYENWSGNQWVSSNKEIYTYDGELYTVILGQVYNQGDDTWADETRLLFEYENGNATHERYEKWEDGQWISSASELGHFAMPYNYNNDVMTLDEPQTSDVYLTYANLLDVKENAANMSISVYPNPVQGEMSIEVEGFAKAELYDLAGRMVMESKVNTMNVNGLQSGIYMLKVYDANGQSEMQKVVVK